MKKVVIVIDSLGGGGAEKSLINLLSLIDYSKYQVDLAVFARGGINEKYVPEEVNFLPVVRPSGNNGIIGKIGSLVAKWGFSFSIRVNKIKTANEQAIRYWKYFKDYLPELSDTYDVAFAYAQRLPTMFTAAKVKAKSKYAWINVTIHHDEELRNFYLPFFNEFQNIICVSKDVE